MRKIKIAEWPCAECGGQISCSGNRGFTKKVFDKTYFLKICDLCMTKKFSLFPTKKKVYNVLSEMTCYAFKIPENIKDKRNSFNAVTEKNLIEKYGKELGISKWKTYREKQARSNTFAYKAERYGWDKNKFDSYNKSRAVTLENLKKRHGEETGTRVFEEYKKKQATNGCSLSYFKEKYGEDAGLKKYKEVNALKARTLDNYIKKYGEAKGRELFIERNKNGFKSSYSKISQKLFDSLREILQIDCRYATHKGEYGKLLHDRYIFIDFFIPEFKIAVEFFGDFFHANPTMFAENDNPNFLCKNKTAGEIWNWDKTRISKLKELHDIDTIVVWERDFRKNPQQVCENVVQEIQLRKKHKQNGNI